MKPHRLTAFILSSFGMFIFVICMLFVFNHQQKTVNASSPSQQPANPPTLTAAGLSLSAASESLAGDPDTNVTYTLTVTNTGDSDDTFTITLDGEKWSSTPSLSSIDTLAPDAEKTFTVEVSIPVEALAGSTDTVTVTLTSQTDSQVAQQVELTTTANTVYAISIEPPEETKQTPPGQTATYELTITNDGNTTDSYDIVVVGATWPTTPSLKTITDLDVGKSTTMQVTVLVPADTQGSSKHNVTVQATSKTNAKTVAESTLTTEASNTYNLYMFPREITHSGKPGTVVTYTLYFTNTGNITHSFAVEASSEQWEMSFGLEAYPGDVYDNRTTLTMAPSISQTLQVLVRVPEQVDLLAQNTTLITITSLKFEALQKIGNLTTIAGATYDFELSPSMTTGSGKATASVPYTLYITNTSNISDSYYVQVQDDAQWTTKVIGGPIVEPLEIGETATVSIEVGIPRNPTISSDIATILVTSIGNNNITATTQLSTTLIPPDPISLEDELAAKNPEVVSFDTTSQTANIGGVATYRLTLHNIGTEQAILIVTGRSGNNTWIPMLIEPQAASSSIRLTQVVSDEISLESGAEKLLDFQVNIPETASEGDTDTATVTIGVKDGDPTKQAEFELTTTAQQSSPAPLYLPNVRKN
jgi:uncharacterized membrane protein